MQVPPDRIVAGTYICAAGITRSEITLENVEKEELKAFLEVYGKMGGQYKGNSGKQAETHQSNQKTYQKSQNGLMILLIAVRVLIISLIRAAAALVIVQIIIHFVPPYLSFLL